MANAVKVETKVLVDEQEIHPILDNQIAYGTGNTTQGFTVEVPANTTDQVVDLSNRGTMESVIVSVSQAITDMSVKGGSSTESFPLKPLQEFSEPLTQIKLSNASTTTKHIVDVRFKSV